MRDWIQRTNLDTRQGDRIPKAFPCQYGSGALRIIGTLPEVCPSTSREPRGRFQSAALPDEIAELRSAQVPRAIHPKNRTEESG